MGWRPAEQNTLPCRVQRVRPPWVAATSNRSSCVLAARSPSLWPALPWLAWFQTCSTSSSGCLTRSSFCTSSSISARSTCRPGRRSWMSQVPPGSGARAPSPCRPAARAEVASCQGSPGEGVTLEVGPTRLFASSLHARRASWGAVDTGLPCAPAGRGRCVGPGPSLTGDPFQRADTLPLGAATVTVTGWLWGLTCPGSPC